MLHAHVEGPYIILWSQHWNPKLMEIARASAGSSRWIKRSLRLELIPENILLLESLSQSHDIHLAPEIISYAQSLRRDQETSQKQNSSYDGSFPFKTKPFEHQLQGWLWSKDLEACAYFLKPGHGKTKIALDVAHYSYLQKRIDLVLIVAPKGVHAEWITDQAPKHLGCPWLGKVISTQTKQSELKKFFEENKSRLVLFALNTEALSVRNGFNVALNVLSLGKAMMIVDESSCFKNPSAKRTKALLALRDKTVMRRILDGTPVSKGVEDLFAPMQFLRPGITGCSTFTAFKNRFCILGGYTGWDIVGYRDLETLYKRIKPVVYQPDIVTDLPEKQVIERFFDLDKSERHNYETVRKKLLLELRDGIIPITQGAARAIKLSQITSGFMLGDEGVLVWRAEQSGRRDMFAAVAHELSSFQFVVFAQFRQEIADIVDVLKTIGISCCVYDTDHSERLLEEFREGKHQAMVLQYQAGSLGLNLQHCSYGIFYSSTFSARLRWQAEARLHRQGQTSNVTFYELLARNTIDVRWKTLRLEKESLAEMTRSELLTLLGEEANA